jgi:phage gp36-like protein
MPYVTQEQLEDRYGARALVALTDRGEAATGLVDVDTVNRALADTDAVIDGHIAGRYALPVAEVPPLLTEIAGAIAFYKLHPHEPDAKVVRDHEQALADLRRIADGKVRLPIAGRPAQPTGGSGARLTDRPRPMTGDGLKGYI